MGHTVHVFDFLEQRPAPAPVAVLFGDEPFLKQLARKQICGQVWPDEDMLAAHFDGTSVEWRDVRDELSTASLFNPSGMRLAVVQDADDFVQNHRSRLEEYVERPEKRAVLVLDVTKWASNTRLYKLVDKQGLQVECRAPVIEHGKQKAIDQPRIIQWLIAWAKTRHEVQLAKNAAAVLVDIIGAEFGLLDQEIAKLALFAGPSGKVNEKLVKEVSGGGGRRRLGRSSRRHSPATRRKRCVNSIGCCSPARWCRRCSDPSPGRCDGSPPPRGSFNGPNDAAGRCR